MRAMNADGHQHRGAKEGCPPLPAAEEGAQERAEGNAQAEGGLVQDDRGACTAARDADDDSQGRSDEQRVAQAPAGPEADEFSHACGGARQRGEHDDDGQADQQRLLAADPGRDEARDQHGDGRDQEIAGEKQRHFTGRRGQVLGDRGQDGIHQPDPHEREHRREGRRPHSLGLLEQRGLFGFERFFCCRQRVGGLAVHGGHS